ncbi:germ cell nuclear acidic protein [Ambystoma mexicanum]|uniref:germ cell nuclear acidic protein n=1 Tax=Ambystoma mexicanum TaxID=8296 RepID=UPI0037E76D55
MDAETRSLFSRISHRLGWDANTDLDQEQERLKESIKKNKKPLFSRTQPVLSLDLEDVESPVFVSCSHRLELSGSDSDSSLKENQPRNSQPWQKWQTGPVSRTSQPGVLIGSLGRIDASIEEPDQSSGKRRGKGKNGFMEPKPAGTPVVISDSSDDDFENFLTQLKTPKSACQESRNLIDGLKDFIVESDEEFTFDLSKKSVSSKKGLQKTRNGGTASAAAAGAKPPSPQVFVSPVFLNESSEEDSAVIKSTWRDRHKSSKPKGTKEAGVGCRVASVAVMQNSKKALAPKERAADTKQGLQKANSWEPLPCSGQELDSSEDEFESLMIRLKNRTRPQTPTSTANKNIVQNGTGEELPGAKPLRDNVNGTSKRPVKSRPKALSLPKEAVDYSPPIDSWSPPPIEGISAMRPPCIQISCSPCLVPNCFLQELTSPSSPYVKNFKQKKVELTQRLFAHYNSTIFNLQLPENMEIIWNKKMRKTAGYCITGQTRGPEAQRYARIELSEKVCDSADRLRDTLIHEVCHAATWLINAVRDGHGRFWSCYARKSTVIHPELPMVTRCHSYEINYKFTYQCTRCTTTIGRHSKSLDTQRFVCALCQGQLVLLQSARKGGTSSSTKLTPFAKFVKENYGSARKGTTGVSHAEVMRKLSSDFATKAKVTAS